VVLLDRDMFKFPRRSKYDLVGIDNFAAGFDLTSHLIKLGCRNIRFVELPLSASTVDLRIAGWREAMVRAGLDCGPDRVFAGDVEREDFVRKMLGRDHSRAIICANDMTAATLMQTLTRMGIEVPDEVRLAGFDDLRYASLLSVPLTTMHQPCQAIGQAAIEAMRERIRSPRMARREILLDATLVVRQSCGAQLAAGPVSKGKNGRIGPSLMAARGAAELEIGAEPITGPASEIHASPARRSASSAFGTSSGTSTPSA
jgi:LacI family transcriptional regulator